MPYRFDGHIALVASGEGLYRADLTGAWNIGPVPNGGYQVATSCAAALRALGAPDVVSVSSYFLSPSAPGPADLRVEIIKRGRNTSAAEVRLVQGDRERVRSIVLAGDLTSFAGPDLHTSSRPEIPPPDACVHLSPELGMVPTLMGEVELRFDPATNGFMRGELGASPELAGWLRFADGRAVDVLALTCFADVLPPTTFNALGPTAWVPTLELTTQIRRRPAPGWIQTRVVTRHVTAGHFEEDGELWDSEGHLVAISRQRAMLLGG